MPIKHKTNVVHGVKMSINFPQITAKQLQIFDQEAKLLNSFLKKVAEKWFVVVWTSNSLIKGQAQFSSIVHPLGSIPSNRYLRNLRRNLQYNLDEYTNA